MKRIQFKFFIVDRPTAVDENGKLTNVELSKVVEFINSENIRPTDLASEYLDDNKLMLSVAYREENALDVVGDFLKRHNNGYRLRTEIVGDYMPQMKHSVYLETALGILYDNSEDHNISHALYVHENHVKVILLEHAPAEE